MTSSAPVVAVLGIAAAVTGHILNAQPMPTVDGANIGAAVLEAFGVLVVLLAAVLLAVDGAIRVVRRITARA